MIDSTQSVDAMLAVKPTFSQRVSGGDRWDQSFAHVLENAAHTQPREAVREAATQLVASAFIMPVLASLHESPFLQEPFAPGFAERRFAPLLDQEIADRIAGAANFSLVDVIVDRLLGPVGQQGAALGTSSQERPHGVH